MNYTCSRCYGIFVLAQEVTWTLLCLKLSGLLWILIDSSILGVV
jgi:hypothetical protein